MQPGPSTDTSVPNAVKIISRPSYYCDNGDDDNEEEDNKDTCDPSEPTSTVQISQRKPPPETFLSHINDDKSQKYKRKFGGDISNIASSSKKWLVKKRNSSSLSVVADIDNNPLADNESMPPSMYPPNPVSLMNPTNEVMNPPNDPVKLISHPLSKLKTKRTTTSSRPTNRNQPRKVSLDQATISLDQVSPTFKKSRITNNSDSSTLSAEGMFPWEGYMDEDFDNDVDPDPDYEPLYEDEVRYQLFMIIKLWFFR